MKALGAIHVAGRKCLTTQETVVMLWIQSDVGQVVEKMYIVGSKRSASNTWSVGALSDISVLSCNQVPKALSIASGYTDRKRH